MGDPHNISEVQKCLLASCSKLDEGKNELQLLVDASKEQFSGAQPTASFQLPPHLHISFQEGIKTTIASLQNAINSLTPLLDSQELSSSSSSSSSSSFSCSSSGMDRARSRKSKALPSTQNPLFNMFDHTNPEYLKNIIIVQSLIRRRLAKRARQRLLTEQELISTERHYANDLFILLHKILKPLRESDPFVLTKEEETSIFGLPYLENMHKSHVFFLTLLQDSHKNSICFAELFSDAANFLFEYEPYVTNFDNSMATLTKCSQKPEFRKFLRNYAKDKDLQSYLILPIQRIPRYVMLLNKLKSYSSPKEFGAFEKAIRKVESICSEINQKKKVMDNACRISQLQLCIGKKVSLSNDWVLKEGFVYVSGSNSTKTGRKNTVNREFSRWLTISLSIRPSDEKEVLPIPPSSSSSSSSRPSPSATSVFRRSHSKKCGSEGFGGKFSQSADFDKLNLLAPSSGSPLGGNSTSRGRASTRTSSVAEQQTDFVLVYVVCTKKLLLLCTTEESPSNQFVRSSLKVRFRLKVRAFLGAVKMGDTVELFLDGMTFYLRPKDNFATTSWATALVNLCHDTQEKEVPLRSLKRGSVLYSVSSPFKQIRDGSLSGSLSGSLTSRSRSQAPVGPDFFKQPELQTAAKNLQMKINEGNG